MSKLMKLNQKIERLEQELEYLRNRRDQHYRVDQYGDRSHYRNEYGDRPPFLLVLLVGLIIAFLLVGG